MADAAAGPLAVTANVITPRRQSTTRPATHVVEGPPIGRSTSPASSPSTPRSADRARRHRRPDPAGGRQPPGRRGGFQPLGKLTDDLVEASQLPVVGEVGDQSLNPGQPPASTAVEVRRLARDDLGIEVEAVAVISSFPP
jgi:hypothetical protein